MKLPCIAFTALAALCGAWIPRVTEGLAQSESSSLTDKQHPPGPQGYALTIGVNAVDTSHYGKSFPQLKGCEADAADMALIADHYGFDNVTTLTGRTATAQNVADSLRAIAHAAVAGDTVLVSFAGHGSQVPDRNYDEPDEQDETWVLYDRQLLDDELYALLALFSANIHLIVVSDSCHSGSITRSQSDDYTVSVNQARLDELDLAWTEAASTMLPEIPIPIPPGPEEASTAGHNDDDRSWAPPTAKVAGIRSLSPSTSIMIYRNHKPLYDQIGATSGSDNSRCLAASLVSISACKDNQVAIDLEGNGLFTLALKTVVRNDDPPSYRDLHSLVRDFILECNYHSQQPVLVNSSGDPDYTSRHPFAIQ